MTYMVTLFDFCQTGEQDTEFFLFHHVLEGNANRFDGRPGLNK